MAGDGMASEVEAHRHRAAAARARRQRRIVENRHGTSRYHERAVVVHPRHDWYPARMPTPALTAVVCTYNHGQYLRRALHAIVSQSRPPDELIVVDDGSTDHTPSVLDEFQSSHPGTIVVRSPRNVGFHAAFASVYASRSPVC